MAKPISHAVAVVLDTLAPKLVLGNTVTFGRKPVLFFGRV